MEPQKRLNITEIAEHEWVVREEEVKFSNPVHPKPATGCGVPSITADSSDSKEYHQTEEAVKARSVGALSLSAGEFEH